jgi:hypothetical protein
LFFWVRLDSGEIKAKKFDTLDNKKYSQKLFWISISY